MADSKKSGKNKKKRNTYRVAQPNYKPPKRPKVGGQYPPPPKKAIITKLSDYKLALVQLNKDLLKNIKFIIGIREDTDNGLLIRLKAAEILLKRTMPEIKAIQVVDGSDTPDSGYTDDQLKEMAKIYSRITITKPNLQKRKK